MRDAKYKEKRDRIALITGITGQDGSYLVEFLLGLKDYNYHVHGIIRRSSSFNTSRIDHIYDEQKLSEHPRLTLHYGDLTDSTNIASIVSAVRPDEIFNLAAQSHVKVSFEMPEYTSNVDAIGIVRLLEAVRSCGLEKTVRVYQASTSELYGGIYDKAQNETTPFYPRSPYAVSKLFAYWFVVNYREAYGIYACNGILFNHESPRRGRTFVTRKITKAVADCYNSLSLSVKGSETLYLGNIDSLRDWGHARDYVEGMWLMLQQEKPEDFVLATGKQISVRSFVEKAYAEIGLTITWSLPESSRPVNSQSHVNEIGTDQNGVVRVRIDPRYYRPSEVENLLGDPKKAKEILGWEARTTINDLIKEMVAHDIAKSYRF